MAAVRRSGRPGRPLLHPRPAARCAPQGKRRAAFAAIRNPLPPVRPRQRHLLALQQAAQSGTAAQRAQRGGDKGQQVARSSNDSTVCGAVLALVGSAVLSPKCFFLLIIPPASSLRPISSDSIEIVFCRCVRRQGDRGQGVAGAGAAMTAPWAVRDPLPTVRPDKDTCWPCRVCGAVLGRSAGPAAVLRRARAGRGGSGQGERDDAPPVSSTYMPSLWLRARCHLFGCRWSGTKEMTHPCLIYLQRLSSAVVALITSDCINGPDHLGLH